MSRNVHLNSILVTVGSIATAFAQWYYVWLFARSPAGPASVGLYSSILAVATPIFVIVQLGLRNVYLTLAVHVEWRVYLVLRGLGIGAGVLSLAIISSVALDVPPQLVGAIAIFKAAHAVSDLYYGRLQRQRRLGLLGFIWCMKSAVTVIAATVIVTLGGSIAAAVASGGAIALVAAAWSASSGDPARQSASETSSGNWRHVLGAGTPVAFAQTLSAMTVYLPILLLASFATPEEVGIFTAASYLLVFANLLGASLQVVVIPSMRAQADLSGRSAVWVRTVRLVLSALAVSLPPVLIVTITGGTALEFLYGDGFALAWGPLLLLSTAAALALPGQLLGAAMLVFNDYRGQTTVSLASFTISVAVGVALFSLIAPITAACGTAAAAALVRLCHAWGRGQRFARMSGK